MSSCSRTRARSSAPSEVAPLFDSSRAAISELTKIETQGVDLLLAELERVVDDRIQPWPRQCGKTALPQLSDELTKLTKHLTSGGGRIADSAGPGHVAALATIRHRACFVEVAMNGVAQTTEVFQITFRDFPASEALEGRVRARADKLFALCAKITTCRVVLEAPHQRHRHGRKFRCRVDLVVPNAELVAQNADAAKVSEDAYAAIDGSFDELTRQLEDYTRRSRWDVKQHDPTPHGRVAKLMVGGGPGTRYGFLETHDGREVFFHEHSVLHGRFDDLEIGTKVRFAEEEGEKGPQASTVVMTSRRSSETTTTASAEQLPEPADRAAAAVAAAGKRS
jgi:cold shock CspA family protein/ribosome-associated translation inhibitor RaiA